MTVVCLLFFELIIISKIYELIHKGFEKSHSDSFIDVEDEAPAWEGLFEYFNEVNIIHLDFF